MTFEKGDKSHISRSIFTICLRAEQTPLTKVDFVVRFQVSLLVEAAATDGAAVGFLSGVDQLVPLQLVGVRELLSAHRTVVPDLLFGLF